MNSAGFDPANLRLLVGGGLIAFLLLTAARVSLALFEAVVHRQATPGALLHHMLRLVVLIAMTGLVFIL